MTGPTARDFAAVDTLIGLRDVVGTDGLARRRITSTEVSLASAVASSASQSEPFSMLATRSPGWRANAPCMTSAAIVSWMGRSATSTAPGGQSSMARRAATTAI